MNLKRAKKLKLLRIYLLFLPVLLLFACQSQKKVVYFQTKEKADTVSVFRDTGYTAVIQPNDILNIFVASISAEASKFFNYSENPNDDNSMATGFLVDSKGNIQMPLVGVVKVGGLTSAEARDSITRKLEKYLINPSVKLSIRNYRVTVLGEVNHPGVFLVPNERITLPEALALAGDMTVFSNRENILLIREKNGIKEFVTINLTQRDLFNSPYYYLHCNDIIYVEPTRNKRFLSQNYYRVMPVVFGGLATLIAIFNLTQP
ncbi:MAG: polysaccharide export protein [Bacteroidetes bacterium]|nr:MAG: polysaccharide export protein [Bacteroidota bacterium]REK07251.1 MAG: polysaccharide export protein [Bacteroidota bacterium]REK31762.1 MAG: polysaccharide export protein [Bacteroidota bacterium]REK48058.1 MAG: polysaccharide export protein [Bacteroidota bacterium]